MQYFYSLLSPCPPSVVHNGAVFRSVLFGFCWLDVDSHEQVKTLLVATSDSKFTESLPFYLAPMDRRMISVVFLGLLASAFAVSRSCFVTHS